MTNETCRLCDGGQVHLMIQGRVVETIDCPHCEGGNLTDAQAARQDDDIQACRAAEANVDLGWQ